MDIQFIYDVVESNYSGLECYSIYDFVNNDVVYDVNSKKCTIALDIKNKIICLHINQRYTLAML